MIRLAASTALAVGVFWTIAAMTALGWALESRRG